MQLLYADITKADQRIASGIASTDTIDDQPGVLDGQAYVGDVVDTGAVEGALDDYLKWSNVREMHTNSAVGTAITAKVIDGKLHLSVKVVDDGAWEKVKQGVYKGFSIGGRALKSRLEQLPDGRFIRRILKMVLTEISLVDRPANPEARILVFKGADMAGQETDNQDTETGDDPIADVRKLAGKPIKKAAADPAKIVAMIQASRNELELAGDMEGAALLTQAIALVQQASGEAEEAPADELTAPAADAAAESETTDPALTMAAKAGALRKAGRLRMSKRLAGIEAMAKSMLQLAADAGSEWATKVLGVAKDDGSDDIAMAEKVSAAILPYFETLAKGVLAIHGDVEVLKRQPAAGGPVIRSVQKVIAGQTPAALETSKPAMSVLVHEQLDNLQRMARTAANPALAKQYDDQYQLIKMQYSE